MNCTSMLFAVLLIRQDLGRSTFPNCALLCVVAQTQRRSEPRCISHNLNASWSFLEDNRFGVVIELSKWKGGEDAKPLLSHDPISV
jgi:hypothetical protein